LQRIRAIRQRDYWLGLVALAGVLTVGVLGGVLVAVLISLLVLLHELGHRGLEGGRVGTGMGGRGRRLSVNPRPARNDSPTAGDARSPIPGRP
jgi:MFS superfamily sulfate permease-like transporter